MVKNWLLNTEWKKYKKFTHFDILKKFWDSQEKINFFENLFDSQNIISHNFWPFIRYNSIEKKFTLYKNDTPNDNYYYEEPIKWNLFWHKKKVRPITYASHIDSYIYSYYSYLLWIEYEKFLTRNWIWENIIAYRSIKNSIWIWKNNINFILDAFWDIINCKNCIVIALDISSFFDTLNHKILKKEIIKILWVTKLSDDWYKIYKNITQFNYIEKEYIDKNNLIKKIWKTQKIIDIKRFNELKNEAKKIKKNIIKTNIYNYWIPQWTPISWMLANIYMNNFDLFIKKKMEDSNWKYYRYSDDILLIIPSNNNEDELNSINKLLEIVSSYIKDNLKLEINDKKTEINIFTNWEIAKNIIYSSNNTYIYKSSKIIQPLQYLWFTFSWKRLLIRNKSLSKYYKKLIQSLKRLYHLKDENKDGWTNIKWEKILLWKHNRKYLYNWEITGNPYVKINDKWLKQNIKSHYLWFLSYWYNAYQICNPFCEKYNIKNWIKKQLSWHRKKYYDLLKKYWII